MAEIIAAENTAERHELNRLLYVAMTRARDRLYIAGFMGKKSLPAGCWYELARSALAPDASLTGDPVYRNSSEQIAAHEKPRTDYEDENVASEIPLWASEQAPREPQLSIPLAPSRLAPYETDESGEALPKQPPRDTFAEPNPPSPAHFAHGGREDSRFLRGTLTHALLQHLPALDPKSWPNAAKIFVRSRGKGLSAKIQSSIVSETLRVLDDDHFAPIFGPLSRAEVPIVASIPNPSGRGPALKITGQIDRLADTGRDVLIVDYKTNRPPPEDPAKVADVYVYQLAAYRLAIAEIFPDRAIRAAILWTETPRLMEISAELLDTYSSKLWELNIGRLDV
jgi:ATP-dependent helicase/nuclease subunit A